MNARPVQLVEVAEIGAGQGAPQDPKAFTKDGHAFIRAGSLETLCGGDGDSRLERIDDKSAAKHGMRLYPSDTVVFAKSGMSATKNRIYRLRRSAYIVNHLATIVPTQVLEPTYLRYWLEHFNPTRLIQDTSYPSISLEAVESVAIPLPDFSEQRRIAERLEQADRLRRTRRYALELTDTFLPAAFLELFGSGRDSRWDRCTLGELTLDFSYGTSTKCSDNSALQAVLRIPNVIRGAIDTADLKFGELTPNEQKKLRLEHGDLLFVRTNGNPDYVGRCAVFDLEADLYFASYLIRARTDQKLIAPVFLAAYLRMPDGRSSMQPSIRTTAGQYNVSVEGLRDVQVIVPPLPLQQKFAALVERVERLRAVQREALRQAEHLFQTLLNRAFNGVL